MRTTGLIALFAAAAVATTALAVPAEAQQPEASGMSAANQNTVFITPR